VATWRVTCREKHSLYERIVAIGCVQRDIGTKRRITEDEAINCIDLHTDQFLVERPAGHVTEVEVATRDSRKYLKTKADGEFPDNLLALPPCPSPKPAIPPVPPTRTVLASPSHGDFAPPRFQGWK
jgi:hypothetical protein